jgi:hypothetical protein
MVQRRSSELRGKPIIIGTSIEIEGSITMSKLRRWIKRILSLKNKRRRMTFRPTIESLENRWAPAVVSFAANALQITSMPAPANTWTSPSALNTNTVPMNNRLDATVEATFTFNAGEQAQLSGAALNLSDTLWFEPRHQNLWVNSLSGNLPS